MNKVVAYIFLVILALGAISVKFPRRRLLGVYERESAARIVADQTLHAASKIEME